MAYIINDWYQSFVVFAALLYQKIANIVESVQIWSFNGAFLLFVTLLYQNSTKANFGTKARQIQQLIGYRSFIVFAALFYEKIAKMFFRYFRQNVE